MLHDKSGVHHFFLLLSRMSAFLDLGSSQGLLESKKKKTQADLLLSSLLKTNDLKV